MDSNSPLIREGLRFELSPRSLQPVFILGPIHRNEAEDELEKGASPLFHKNVITAQAAGPCSPDNSFVIF